jgi:hypothetical protein
MDCLVEEVNKVWLHADTALMIQGRTAKASQGRSNKQHEFRWPTDRSLRGSWWDRRQFGAATEEEKVAIMTKAMYGLLKLNYSNIS